MNIQDKFVATIMGVAIGDALGAPYETMNFADIKRLFIPSKFVSSKFNKFLKGLSLPPGSWTDDTQLTSATIESLIEASGEVCMDVIEKYHVLTYKNQPLRGWGKSTRNSCARLASETHNWENSGEPDGNGNGVMMKISPLGLRQGLVADVPGLFFKHCFEFGRMTHQGQYALVGGAIHAYAISLLLNQNPDDFDKDDFVQKLHAMALFFDGDSGNPDFRISTMILRAKEMVDKKKTSPMSIAKTFNGAICYTPYSFGASYAAFLSDPFSFDSVNKVILAGGDTDSNAGIVGSCLGALSGMSVFPAYLVRDVEASDLIQNRARRLFEVLNNKVKTQPNDDSPFDCGSKEHLV